MLLLIMSVTAYAVDIQKINMKTTDFFIIQFEVQNVNDIDLRNCVPYFYTSDNVTRTQVTFNPEIFALKGRGTTQTISGKLQGLSPGYYEGNINVKCERYDGNGQLVDVADIIAFGYTPKYDIYVTPAGIGQDYVFTPLQSYTFLARPGETKSATFNIVNTGKTDLPVDITPQANVQTYLTVEPSTAIIPAGATTPFKITIQIPQNYTGLNTSLDIKIGDYKETFPIIGTQQVLTIGGPAVTTNLFTGTISAGTLKIPVWFVIITIIVAGYFLLKPKEKKAKK